MSIEGLILLLLILAASTVTDCTSNSHQNLVCKERNDGLRCVKTFNSEMIKEVNICKDSMLDIDAIKYECLISTYSYQNKLYNAIKINLTVGNYSLSNASFQWFKKDESMQ